MKATLYKLKEGWVLCSDEAIKEDELHINLATLEVENASKNLSVNILSQNSFGDSVRSQYKKVLTQSPILYSLSPDEHKEIGWFDVEKLALKEYPVRICDSYDVLCHRVGDDMNEQNREHFIKGLKKALELTADRIFTEEDMKQALFDLADVFFNNCQKGITEDDCKKYQDIILQSLSQPKSWEVEIDENFKVLKIIKP